MMQHSPLREINPNRHTWRICVRLTCFSVYNELVDLKNKQKLNMIMLDEEVCRASNSNCCSGGRHGEQHRKNHNCYCISHEAFVSTSPKNAPAVRCSSNGLREAATSVAFVWPRRSPSPHGTAKTTPPPRTTRSHPALGCFTSESQPLAPTRRPSPCGSSRPFAPGHRWSSPGNPPSALPRLLLGHVTTPWALGRPDLAQEEA